MLIRRLLLLALVLPAGALAQVSDVSNIVPAVQSWKAAEGALRASSISLEAAPAHVEALKATAAAIREDLALTAHMDDALSSMRIVAAADESFRTGKTIDL